MRPAAEIANRKHVHCEADLKEAIFHGKCKGGSKLMIWLIFAICTRLPGMNPKLFFILVWRNTDKLFKGL